LDVALFHLFFQLLVFFLQPALSLADCECDNAGGHDHHHHQWRGRAKLNPEWGTVHSHPEEHGRDSESTSHAKSKLNREENDPIPGKRAVLIKTVAGSHQRSRDVADAKDYAHDQGKGNVHLQSREHGIGQYAYKDEPLFGL
jgi:hypothetical protein